MPRARAGQRDDAAAATRTKSSVRAAVNGKSANKTQNADLLALLEKCARARVVVVGDLVADEYVLGETERVSREAPVLVVRYERSELRAGCAANAVMNLCALGAQVRPVGLVGDDPIGARLRAMLAEAGADVRGILVAAGESTASKTRILAGGKNTRRQQIVRLDRDGPRPPEGALRDALVRALRTAARGADALLVSDYGLGVPSSLHAELSTLGRSLPLCADARYSLRTYGGAALLKPNEVELEQAVGRQIGDDLRALESAARALLRDVDAGVLLVTRGRSGMAVVRPDLPTVLLPAHGAHEAVDVTGAGDTVMATMTLALACKADPVEAARLANVAGALVVKKPGTATVSAAELAAELAVAEVARGGTLAAISGKKRA